MLYRNLFCAAAALALSACGSNEAEEDAADVGVAEQPAMPGPVATDPAVPDISTPQAFVDAVAASDTFEIESSKLAQSQAKSQEVRAFAETMVEDHTKSTANLKDAASKASPPLTVNASLTPQQQADLEQLRNAGDNFDRLYMQKQVAAHRQAVDMLNNYASQGDSEPLKEFASKTAPIVSGHLERARAINP